MKNKSKITTAAALAALTVPAAAFGHDGDDDRGKSAERASKTGQEQRSESRGKGEDRRVGGKSHRGHHRGHHRGFVIAGVDAANVPKADGPLAGPITLDPVKANKGAKKFLSLTKETIRGEGTVPVGTAGDAVKVRYIGLTANDAILPTDRVWIKGKLRRQGEGATATKTLDIKKVVVFRPGAGRKAH